MIQPPNKNTIMRFYRLMQSSNFANLDETKMQALDEAVNHWRTFFNNKSCGLLSLMTFTAEKMITSNGRYTAVTPEEKVYFYIKMIDPELYFLEAYESGNTMDEIKELCFLNFRLYDPYLIHYEKKLCNVLTDAPDDMWALERIKR
ncbi:MAG: hypothetical protein E7167_05165 [Firmicutes bacterium]|nr:hypothetical protein [Bacillota bacterium]